MTIDYRRTYFFDTKRKVNNIISGIASLDIMIYAIQGKAGKEVLAEILSERNIAIPPTLRCLTPEELKALAFVVCKSQLKTTTVGGRMKVVLRVLLLITH
ncbi:hypothetical protein SPFM20_00026 [Salmonella phage SPFM20]|nr:hypothetical protein SPFM20_00026 [Salmonella phage SPFM20]